MIRKLTRGNETVKAKFADVEASGGRRLTLMECLDGRLLKWRKYLVAQFVSPLPNDCLSSVWRFVQPSARLSYC
jgi:hypothetical protein